MSDLPRTSPGRQLVPPATAATALSCSSAEYRGGQGADDAPPPPQFNLPDSYWAQPRVSRTRGFLETPASTDLIARCVAASDESKTNIAAMFERLDADRENDPRSRTEGRAFLVNTTFQPARFELSAETLARLVVLMDPEGDALAHSPAASSATESATGVAQQDAAASGCCIPPSCTIL